jgi:hypothetical protein
MDVSHITAANSLNLTRTTIKPKRVRKNVIDIGNGHHSELLVYLHDVSKRVVADEGHWIQRACCPKSPSIFGASVHRSGSGTTFPWPLLEDVQIRIVSCIATT